MTNYHFFKIILQDNLSQNELKLPLRFTRLYGKTLPDSVLLRPPFGPQWRIGVAKRMGKVWLGQGWQEFAKNFSIRHGNLIFFRYKGNAEFKVSICNASSCQIPYPNEPPFRTREDKQKHGSVYPKGLGREKVLRGGLI